MSRASLTQRGQNASPSRPDAPSLPFGMEGTAGDAVEGDGDERALMRALNYFPTPPWAARAGGELIASLDPQAQSVWEPACGAGHMAGPLRERFGSVLASDIHDHGFGLVHDFLGDAPFVAGSGVDWVVTNPPFAKAEAFVELGLSYARRGVAVLCRLAFVESVGRYSLMRRMAVMAPFAERVPMQLGSWDPDLSSATAYAWFVWMHDAAIEASPFRTAIVETGAAGGNLIRMVPPGTCDRLTRADDRAIWAGEVHQPDLLGANHP